jgi:trimethylamine--corrinoid protein Co-methyltransferase
MIDCAYAQVGKSLELPTHAYMGLSDAKVVDAQSGLESLGGIILAALTGINMISGAGMMDFESCQSFEKLVIDAEIIGMAKRLVAGIEIRDKPIALDLMRSMGHEADYLIDSHTVKWFQDEFYIPSKVIDRSSYDAWKRRGGKSAFDRSSERVDRLLGDFKAPPLTSELKDELRRITTKAAQNFGMAELPPIPME